MQIFTKAYKPPRWLLTAATAMLVAGSAHAQTGMDVSNTTNYGSASWGVGTGTSAFLVAGPYDAVTGTATDYFYDAGSNIEIAGATAPAFYNATFDNGAARTAAITNTAGIDVANNLTLLNGITTTPNTVAGAIRMGSAATTTGSGTFSATRYVDGYIAKAGATAFTYPVGAGGFYSPMTLSNPSGTTVRYTRGNQGSTGSKSTSQGANNLATVSVLEYYPISNSTTPAGATMTIPYSAGAQSGVIMDPTTLTIAGFDGTNWVNLSGGAATVNTTNKTVTVTLAQSLSGITAFALGSTSFANPLPVKLVEFAAVKTADGAGAELSWDVNNEQSIASYHIERSADAQNFTAIGEEMKAKNAPSGEAAYLSYDYNPAKGNNYYRLRISANDGTISYSPLRMLSFTDKSVSVVNIYPNPAQVQLEVEAADAVNGHVRIYSAGNGALAADVVLSKEGFVSVDVSRFAAGVYFVRVSDKNEKVVANEKVNILR